MSEWKMDPAQLATALENTARAHEDLTGVVTQGAIDAIFSGLTWGGWVTAAIPQTLSEVLAEQQDVNLANISNRVAAGIAGVGNAARALQEGQEEMASTFQTEMAAAAESGDFSYFEANGYSGE